LKISQKVRKKRGGNNPTALYKKLVVCYKFQADIHLMKTTKRFYGLASVISLLLGMGIYLFFRNANMLIFELIPKPEFFQKLYIPLKHSLFSSLLLYNLPDALWFLSGILFLRFLWFHNEKWQRIYILCFYGIAVIFEISQLSENVPGTFDWLDLLFMGVTAFVEGLLYKFFARRRFG
jgi:hypothetical protein